MKVSHACAIVVGILAGLTLSGLAMSDERPPGGLKSWGIFRDVAPIRVGPDGYSASLSRVIRDSAGKAVAKNVFVIGPPHTDYPDLREGDIVPMFGSLYRVSKIAGNGLTVTWIPTKDAPEDITIKPGNVAVPALVIPLNTGAEGDCAKMTYGTRHDWQCTFLCKAIELRPSGKKMQLIATLVMTAPKTKGLIRDYACGDVIAIDDEKWEVRRIVPLDRKRQIIGWVELSRIERTPEELAKSIIEWRKMIEEPKDESSEALGVSALFGNPPIPPKFEPPPEIRKLLLERRLKYRFPLARGAALVQFQHFFEDDVPALIPILRDGLNDPDAWVRSQAAYSLQTALHLLLNDGPPGRKWPAAIRAKIAERKQDMVDEIADLLIFKGLTDTDLNAAYAAYIVLADHMPPSAIRLQV